VANMQPLRREDHPELEELWQLYDDSLSFVPNSLFTMARRPEILAAFSDLITRIWRTGTVPVGLKPLIAIVASAAAHDTGLPPNVEPWDPNSQFMRSSRAIIAPSGMPLAIPLPESTMSGSTPKCSIAHILPVRPMPLWTSSATSRMPCSSHTSRR